MFSVELEDVSEVDSRGKLSVPTSPLVLDERKSPKFPEFPLSLLQSQQKCEVYADLHKIIQVCLLLRDIQKNSFTMCHKFSFFFFLQDKFMEIGAQYFKTVPSNPHYFFYRLPSSKKEVC